MVAPKKKTERAHDLRHEGRHLLHDTAATMLATLSLLVALAPPHAHFAPRRIAAPSRAAVVVAAAATPETQEALINKLRSANAAQLPALLGDNMGAVDQRLFLRLAELSDAASDDAERNAISQLASTVATVVEDLLNQAEQQLDADAQNAQALLQAAASASGEFDVPIPPERAEAVRAAVQQRLGALDEGFVATVSAYMKKAGDDNMEGLVELLREVLQIFAAEKLLATIEASLAADDALRGALTAILRAPSASWDAELRAQLLGEDASVGVTQFLGALQDKMGEVVLGMPSGSQVQGILAEYLSELTTAARKIAAEEA